MRAVVFSDSHGDFDVLERIVEKHLEDAELFIHLGDGEMEFELLHYVYLNKKMLFVRGNCDYRSQKPGYDIVDFGGKRIYFTHGADLGVKLLMDPAIKEAKKHEADILLFGHTHIPMVSYEEGIHIMNPGSCGKPRQGGPSYGIIDITEAGIHMHTVNI